MGEIVVDDGLEFMIIFMEYYNFIVIWLWVIEKFIVVVVNGVVVGVGVNIVLVCDIVVVVELVSFI